jgi:hypothetical protein
MAGTGGRQARPTGTSTGATRFPAPADPAAAKRIAWLRQFDATAVAVGLAGLIAVLEINRLSTSVLNSALVSRGISELSAPFAAWKTGVWDHWADLGSKTEVQGADSVAGWIALTAGFDLLFIAGYGWLLLRAVRASESPVARRSLQVLVGAELAETALLWVGAAFLAGAGVPVPVRVLLAAATTIKWLALVVLVVALLRDRPFRKAFNRALVHAFRALRVQRLSLLIVVVIGALSLVPGPDLSDQFPDVLRGWFDVRSPQADLHLAAGVLVYLLAGLTLFVLGRQRSERSWEAHVGHTDQGPMPPVEPTQHCLWLLGPVGAGVVAAVLLWRGKSDLIDGRVLLVFLLVPLVLLVASAIVGKIYGDEL